MSDEKARPKEPVDNTFRGNDPRTIDVDNPVEVAYWVKALGVPEEVLRAVVASVGTSAQRVKDYLK